ncbi:flagellar hook protein FlgE [Micromonospora pattaloongensis]|uniref:Flagellar hook protein FlgE n=1 Tax=Micromonospora pattaloongensis TaxID=405436 RepID=A0A1H3MX82_9ACTN|nr:flagellar hook protein FlgE [Micromonospora pattaloongensis]SDY81302.1 flagellar hook protein FlgE [Micromonospora pattaloongensis]
MLRSLFSSISGLRAHQQMMDVTGNNIANVNTAGFKASQTTFQDTLSQLVQAAGAPGGGNGGTNPAQVGLGVRLGGINTNFSQGGVQSTGRGTDLMIQGDGFFVVRSGNEELYTRSGAFNFDTDGRLTASGGRVVRGWMAVNGVINTSGPMADIRLPLGATVPATPTSTVTVGGNLPLDATSAGPYQVSIDGYDALGNTRTFTASFTRTATAPNPTWDVTVTGGDAPVTQSVTFAANGSAPTAGGTVPITVNGLAVDVELAGVSSYAGEKTLTVTGQNGSQAGTLQAYTIAPDGALVGVFSNGQKQPLGQVALANFNNPPGLEKVGDSMYRTSVNSGVAQVGVAGTGGRGALQGMALEMSNVDLAQEFTNLVIAQRGFQANSRVITTSDELLQDLVNLKR